MPLEISADVVVMTLAIVLATATLASAIEDHARTVRELNQSRPVPLTVLDSTWRIVVAQLAADGLNEAVEICSFSSMQVLRHRYRVAWIRFVLPDGRALVFATAPRVIGCRGRGKCIDTQRYPQSSCELHQIWMYFMALSGQATPIPRDVRWYVFPLQTPQDRLGQAIILRNPHGYKPGLMGRFQQLLEFLRRS